MLLEFELDSQSTKYVVFGSRSMPEEVNVAKETIGEPSVSVPRLLPGRLLAFDDMMRIVTSPALTVPNVCTSTLVSV